MSARLATEIQRLYRLPGDPAASAQPLLPLVDTEGQVRALVMAIGGPADWPALSSVWRGVQADLDLPAPAIAVNGVDAYELWFSLAQPVPLFEGERFLQGLRQRYLPDVPGTRLVLRPSAQSNVTPLIPACQGDAGLWSAYVAPDLAAVFGDEPVLDVPPGDDAQADLLSRVACMSPAAFGLALQRLHADAAEAGSRIPLPSETLAGAAGLNGPYKDPRRFLQDVMNEATAPLALRIEAAKALLAHRTE